ncbi:DUF2889 domain-containing protein [Sphingomonas profundi]|uniref:DUF2889 domain-containing protein n=1 Tax=Alterirhizorhabdus profundi TaxID=2681549 RepID=UPI001E55E0D2|nr:DUF2889 domain-containing protein [Sphingomonas profundi]
MTGTPGLVLAELEDHAHGMRCRLRHDGAHVVDVEAEFIRYPLSTCLGADLPLRALVGEALGRTARDFFAGGRARVNCTHMFDLAWLASRHALRGARVRDYLMAVPDAPEGRTDVTLSRDGAEILRWRIEDDVITDPAPFAGRHLYRGFVSWALSAPELDDDLTESVLVLHKACFVSGARRFALASGPLEEAEKRATVGVCHGYAAATIDEAVRPKGTRRDFSDHPERLLRYL